MDVAGKPDFLDLDSKHTAWFAATGVGMYTAWIVMGTIAAAWSIAVQSAAVGAGG